MVGLRRGGVGCRGLQQVGSCLVVCRVELESAAVRLRMPSKDVKGMRSSCRSVQAQ